MRRAVSTPALFYRSFPQSVHWPGELVVELVVVRGVACGTSVSDPLYMWLKCVVEKACGERRNVRVSDLASSEKAPEE